MSAQLLAGREQDARAEVLAFPGDTGMLRTYLVKMWAREGVPADPDLLDRLFAD
jgi:hypothetical protein